MARREFSPMVYAEIVRRAMNEAGQLHCESCGELIKGKKYHVDHTVADGLILDKNRKLTAKDGRLLGIKCCHAPKTAEDVAAIAKAKRVEAVHLNIKTRAKQPIPKPPKPAQKSRHDWAPELPRKQLFTKEHQQ